MFLVRCKGRKSRRGARTSFIPFRLHRLASIAGVTIMMLVISPAAHAGVGPPPCINYKHQEQWGSVYVDLRFDPNTGQNTTLSIWWIVDPPTARAGTYDWTHLINDKPLRGPEFAVKDDALHTVVRQFENGKRNWNFYDTYALRASHFSPAERATYLAINNKCTIVPR